MSEEDLTDFRKILERIKQLEHAVEKRYEKMSEEDLTDLRKILERIKQQQETLLNCTHNKLDQEDKNEMAREILNQQLSKSQAELNCICYECYPDPGLEWWRRTVCEICRRRERCSKCETCHWISCYPNWVRPNLGGRGQDQPDLLRRQLDPECAALFRVSSADALERLQQLSNEAGVIHPSIWALMFDEEESTEGSRSRSEDSVISQAQRDNVAAAATAVVDPAAPDGADLTATIDSVRSWVLASGVTAIARFAYAIGATEQSDQELEDDEQDEDEREQPWLLPSTLSDVLTPSSEPPSPPPSPSSEPVPPSTSAVTDIDDEAPAAASKSSNVEAPTSAAARPTEPESPPKPDKGTLVDLLQDRVVPTVLEQLQQVHELGLRLLEVQIGKYAEVRIPTDAESRYYLIATTAHLQSVIGVLYARLEDEIATPEDFRSFF
eukprot:scaffold33972_cov38-Phaeocystis_antarctica.AAC.1